MRVCVWGGGVRMWACVNACARGWLARVEGGCRLTSLGQSVAVVNGNDATSNGATRPALAISHSDAASHKNCPHTRPLVVLLSSTSPHFSH